MCNPLYTDIFPYEKRKGGISPLWEKGDRPKNPLGRREKAKKGQKNLGRREKSKQFWEKGEEVCNEYYVLVHVENAT